MSTTYKYVPELKGCRVQGRRWQVLDLGPPSARNVGSLSLLDQPMSRAASFRSSKLGKASPSMF